MGRPGLPPGIYFRLPRPFVNHIRRNIHLRVGRHDRIEGWIESLNDSSGWRLCTDQRCCEDMTDSEKYRAPFFIQRPRERDA